MTTGDPFEKSERRPVGTSTVPQLEPAEDGPTQHVYYGHGLYYVDRDGQSSYDLLTGDLGRITRPESDVLEALLKYVQDRLKSPWDTDV